MGALGVPGEQICDALSKSGNVAEGSGPAELLGPAGTKGGKDELAAHGEAQKGRSGSPAGEVREDAGFSHWRPWSVHSMLTHPPPNRTNLFGEWGQGRQWRQYVRQG